MMASEAGKGDSPRPMDAKAFGDNYDYIFRRSPEAERLKNAQFRVRLDAMPVAEKLYEDTAPAEPEPVTGAYQAMYPKAHKFLSREAWDELVYEVLKPKTFQYCKHWTKLTTSCSTPYCLNQAVSNMIECDDWRRFESSADFGCNKWEARK